MLCLQKCQGRCRWIVAKQRGIFLSKGVCVTSWVPLTSSSKNLTKVTPRSPFLRTFHAPAWNGALSQRKFLRVRRGCQASQRQGWPPGESRKLPGKSGELPGKSGELPGNPWIAVKFHSERTFGEVAEKLPGKFGELPGKSGDFPEARGSLTPSQRLAKFISNEVCTH